MLGHSTVHPNQAHNGYIEMYLDLGFIGVGMIVLLILTGYRNAVGAYRDNPGFGRFRLALLLVAPIYSITEAAFKLVNPVWVSFMLATTALPLKSSDVPVAAPSPEPGTPREPPRRRAHGAADAVEDAAAGACRAAGFQAGR